MLTREAINALTMGARCLSVSPGGETPGVFRVFWPGVGVERFAPGEHPKTSDAKWMGHAHNVYHVVLYTKGAFDFLFDGRTRPFCPGTLALAGPGQTHQFGPFNLPFVVEYKAFSFTLEDPKTGALRTTPFHEALSEYFGTPLPYKTFPVQLDERRTTLLDGLLSSLIATVRGTAPERHPADFVFDVLALARALAVEVYAADDKAVVVPDRTPVGIRQARALMENRYAEKWTVARLAKTAKLAPTSFIRAFRKNYGTAPIDFLLEKRLEAARSALIATEGPIKEIAVAVGFSDVYYFSRIFRKRTGLPPGRYRKSHRPGHQ